MCYLFIYNYLSSLQLNEGNKTPSVFLFCVNFKENKQKKPLLFNLLGDVGVWEEGIRQKNTYHPWMLNFKIFKSLSDGF